MWEISFGGSSMKLRKRNKGKKRFKLLIGKFKDYIEKRWEVLLDRRIRHLIKRYRKGNERTRYECLEELVKIGKYSVPELIPILKDDSGWMREMAINALGRIGNLSTVPDFIKLLDDDDEAIRMRGFEIFERIFSKILKEIKTSSYEELRDIQDSSWFSRLVNHEGNRTKVRLFGKLTEAMGKRYEVLAEMEEAA